MPPDIQPATSPTPNHVRILTEAINAAVEQLIEVTTGADLGVVCVSTAAPRWELDPGADAVSAFGAVLLKHQPPIPIADRALAHVLGVGPIWTEGFQDGCAGLDPEQNPLSRGTGARLYTDGHGLGLQFRAFIATAVCQPHGIRYPRGGRCWKCAAGATPRPIIEATPPALTTTPPRGIIHQLLSSLTLAQALEALAATVPARGWTTETKADVVEDLRDLAEEYRRERL